MNRRSRVPGVGAAAVLQLCGGIAAQIMVEL